MKWQVEYITTNSCNVLEDSPDVPKDEQEAIGMGFPQKLAERIVKMHNEAIGEIE